MICRDLRRSISRQGRMDMRRAYRRSRPRRQSRLPKLPRPTYLIVLTGLTDSTGGGRWPSLPDCRPMTRAPRAAARRRSAHVPRLQARYYAFLSYSHKDKELADWLHRELEKFRVPHALAGKLTANGVVPRRLTPIFRDQHELAAADDLGEEIKAALGRIAIPDRAVLARPRRKSRWTNAEIEAFKRDPAGGLRARRDRGGEPFASDMPGREARGMLPAGAAPEIRPARAPDRQARRAARRRLARGRRGPAARLPQARRRDARRRARRAGPARDDAAPSAAGLARRGVARRNGGDQHARGHRDPGAQRSARPAPRGRGAGRASCSATSRTSSSRSAGSTRSTASARGCSLITASRTRRSCRDAALLAAIAGAEPDGGGRLCSAAIMTEPQRLYREALAGTAEAIRRDPDDPQRAVRPCPERLLGRRDRASSGATAGHAEAAMREYKRLARQMVALGPDNMKWRMEEQYADAELGIVLFDQRRFGEAAAQFDAALATDGGARHGRPDQSGLPKGAVATSLAWLADAQTRERPARPTRSPFAKRQHRLAQPLARSRDADVALPATADPRAPGRLALLIAMTRGNAARCARAARSGGRPRPTRLITDRAQQRPVGRTLALSKLALALDRLLFERSGESGPRCRLQPDRPVQQILHAACEDAIYPPWRARLRSDCLR